MLPAPSMTRIQLDSSLSRTVTEGFSFPLGSYPVEPLTPKPGFMVHFEPADGSVDTPDLPTGEDWEEWPDRFAFEVLLSNDRVRPFVRTVLGLMPGRVYPILDILGNDAYREIDPYIAYDLVGIEKVYDAIREYDAWLFEDGLVGFGVMSVEPFLYLFVDEHKIITLRATIENKEKFERLLAAFDLSTSEELVAADSVAHEHRTVLAAPGEQNEGLSADEIVERLRDAWLLELNIDTRSNLDAEGKDLGVTAWQCVARCALPESAPDAYAELLLTADSHQNAQKLVDEALRRADPQVQDTDVLRADRITREQLGEWLGPGRDIAPNICAVHDLRWLSGHPGAPAAEGGGPASASSGG